MQPLKKLELLNVLEFLFEVKILLPVLFQCASLIQKFSLKGFELINLCNCFPRIVQNHGDKLWGGQLFRSDFL